MIVLGVDPGTTQSAFVVLNGKKIIEHGKRANEDVLEVLRKWSRMDTPPPMAIENIGGQRRNPKGGFAAVGQETFDTCIWIGRFIERYGVRRSHLMQRSEVVRHVCGKIPRAKEGEKKVSRDTLVRAGVIGLYGEDAIGTKAAPGPLFGLSADQWSALAIAITFRDTRK